jgi:hypothetical protein
MYYFPRQIDRPLTLDHLQEIATTRATTLKPTGFLSRLYALPSRLHHGTAGAQPPLRRTDLDTSSIDPLPSVTTYDLAILSTISDHHACFSRAKALLQGRIVFSKLHTKMVSMARINIHKINNMWTKLVFRSACVKTLECLCQVSKGL